ncbi:DUF1707 domain-containing protein [Rhodococcus sp. NPDC058505]|uniref:DUF1707 SHOCT-like domain-containing protein n=1 Tax=unclassified Rhodococcus (in: high G+C Gram-positive bacteria) TaxID=192944 RepID=UPI00364C0E97
MPTEPDPDLLLSDDERMHALDAISRHYADGRLDSAEFYERSGVIAEARTVGALGGAFQGLPGGMPLAAVDGRVRKVPFDDAPAIRDSSPAAAAEAELTSLRSRGGIVESLDWVIIGITLVTFLVLQIVVDWDYAWLVWPSLIVTLSVPRMILNYSDDDEEVYEKLKESDAKARRKRLEQAARRIRELEDGDGRNG